MKIDNSSTTSALMLTLDEEYASSKPSALVSILTENDGDYFLKICNEEGGGIENRVESFFAERPTGKRMPFSELMKMLKKVIAMPRFTSINGSITLDYSLHIWISGYYIAHAPCTSRTILKKMTTFDKLLHPVAKI